MVEYSEKNSGLNIFQDVLITLNKKHYLIISHGQQQMLSIDVTCTQPLMLKSENKLAWDITH